MNWVPATSLQSDQFAVLLPYECHLATLFGCWCYCLRSWGCVKPSGTHASASPLFLSPSKQPRTIAMMAGNTSFAILGGVVHFPFALHVPVTHGLLVCLREPV